MDVWQHPIYGKESGSNNEYVVAKNTCDIEKLKISIPAPSCTLVPVAGCGPGAENNAFLRGYCMKGSQEQKCDHSAVNAAKAARTETFNACMAVRGWEKKPNTRSTAYSGPVMGRTKSSINPGQSSSESNSEEKLSPKDSEAVTRQFKSVKGLSFEECRKLGGYSNGEECVIPK